MSRKNETTEYYELERGLNIYLDLHNFEDEYANLCDILKTRHPLYDFTFIGVRQDVNIDGEPIWSIKAVRYETAAEKLTRESEEDRQKDLADLQNKQNEYIESAARLQVKIDELTKGKNDETDD